MSVSTAPFPVVAVAAQTHTRREWRLAPWRERVRRLLFGGSPAERVVAALNRVPHGFCLYDAQNRLVFASDGFRRLYSQPVERMPVGSHCLEMIADSVREGIYGERTAEKIWAEREAFIARREPGTFLQVFGDGRLIAIAHQPLPDGGWTALYEDVTERRRRETHLRFMAHHDLLTGLPNRHLFGESLEKALSAVGRGRACTLLCLDLDGFKPVNDRFGHAAGDDLLRSFAERLRGTVRERDVPARLGGDEFAILMADVPPEAALGATERVLAILADPYDVPGAGPVRIGASIGIACAPRHATTAAALLEQADIALYEAKRRGDGRPCLWSGVGEDAMSTEAAA